MDTGLYINRLSTGLFELRTTHRTLGIYPHRWQARKCRTRLLRRGRRCYNPRVKKHTHQH